MLMPRQSLRARTDAGACCLAPRTLVQGLGVFALQVFLALQLSAQPAPTLPNQILHFRGTNNQVEIPEKRIEKLGDLWAPLLSKQKRFNLSPYLK